VDAAIAVPAAPPAAARPWVKGPAWDGLWTLSGLWLAPLVLLLSAGAGDPRDGPLDDFYFGATVLLWLAHRASSVWLAYATEAYRPLRRAEPGRFTVVPLAIAVLCFGILLPPDDALPWSRAERMTGLVILDYLLVTWHFASQHFGVLCVYRVRAGRASSRALRRLDRVYALLVGGGLVVLAEVVSGTVYRIEVWVDPWLDPAAVEAHAGLLRGLGSALAAGFALVLLALEARAERPSWPRAGYVLGLAAMTAVAFHARAPFVFLVLWSAQHWIVAVGLATLVARADPAAEPPRRAPLRSVNRRPWALLLVLVATSVLLLPVLEVEGADDDGALYAPRLFGDLAASLRTSSWAPALLALGLSTAFLHYWLDRAVYRFSNPLARGAARGRLDAPNAGSAKSS
jgi:hypothetical protein